MIQRVLAGKEWRDARWSDVARQVGREVSEILLFRRSDRVVGQEEIRVAPHQPLDRVIHVDPYVRALRVRQPCFRRPQLDGYQWPIFLQPFEQLILHDLTRRFHEPRTLQY